eukprot:122377-Chlamydomonas_euryale.AAC.1
MIPRLSAGNAQRLVREMVSTAARCRVSKSRLWLAMLLLGKQWDASEVFVPQGDIDEVWMPPAYENVWERV